MVDTSVEGFWYAYLGMAIGAAGIAVFGVLLATVGGGALTWIGIYASILLFAISGFLAVRWAR